MYIEKQLTLYEKKKKNSEIYFRGKWGKKYLTEKSAKQEKNSNQKTKILTKILIVN